MTAANVNQILLRALREGLGAETNAFILSEKIAIAVQRCESSLDQAELISHRVRDSLGALEHSELIKTTNGKIRLTEAGIRAADGLVLPPKWDELPKIIKRFILRQF